MKQKKSSLKKLSLTKETITKLNDDKLEIVKGGRTGYISCLAVWCEEEQ